MNTEFIVTSDGSVSAIISYETALEEEMLKQLLKQNNDMSPLNSSVVVFNRTYKGGVLIRKVSEGDKNKTEELQQMQEK